MRALTLGFLIGISLLVLSSCQSTTVRVEFELKKFLNAKGITQTGSKCSRLGNACSHKITGYVDTSVPKKGWPGTKGVETWPVILEQKDNSLTMNKVISSDVCSGNFKEAVLRVHIVDAGGALSSAKLVEDFECLSGANTNIAPNEMQATWSEEKSCQAKFNPDNNRLTFKVRVYALPAASCGRPPARPSGKGH
ncbi:hypothetical protein RvY_12762 [Ramazzottius varieornatus]|uniref:CUB domain-containing protein n=1 Tax=Ramazzottius varieornatus TaxID=947166 RepID=A0A1D1VKL3_RAMVA|nr:hypothetical protein RvY_12762 [Ramazzottius varieornatus]